EADARPPARSAGDERLGAAHARRARPSYLARKADEGSRAGAAHDALDRRGAAPRCARRPVGGRARALRRQPARDQVEPAPAAEQRPMMRIVLRVLLLL